MINSRFPSKPSSSIDVWISQSSSPQPKPKTEKDYYNEIADAKRRLFRCIAASFRMEHSYRSKMGELRKKSLSRDRREELEKVSKVICRNCIEKDMEFEYLKDLVKRLDDERASLYGSINQF
jgi:hypothetical protein